MPQDDPAPGGLLSKVVKFVRNPTAGWADLGQPELDRESQYSKQMLKEMIERKRRNDFVRRREFDQLRKLRQCGGGVGGMADTDAAGRPSFFQSSQPSRADDREGTLKKIDEIEAQMSQQWWARNQGLRAAGANGRPLKGIASQGVGLTQSDARFFAETVPATLPGDPAAGMAMPGRGSIRGGLAGTAATADEGGRWLAPQDELVSFVHDPALEEASIRFANGDATGAELALLPLLAEAVPPSPAHEELWLTLFDLYRAAGLHDKFDTAAAEFCARFGRAAPIWFDMAGGLRPRVGARSDEGAPLAAAAADSQLGGPDSALSSTLPQGADGQIGAAGMLQGEVLGDARALLAPLDAQAERSGLVVVSCNRLIRIDFAAAGSVLNWAATLQTAGVRVQFCELHRLVAVFLNVVGVGEHATILPRRH